MRWQQGVTDVDDDAARKSTAKPPHGGATMPEPKAPYVRIPLLRAAASCATAATPLLRFRPNQKRREVKS